MIFLESLKEFYYDIVLFGAKSYTMLSIMFWICMVGLLLKLILDIKNR